MAISSKINIDVDSAAFAAFQEKFGAGLIRPLVISKPDREGICWRARAGYCAALLAGRCSRRKEGGHRGRSRSEEDQHVVCRAIEPNDPDAMSPAYSAHKCLQQEAREPRGRCGAVRGAL